VMDAVNPLYVHVLNPDPFPLRATLEISQRVGSPWRGWSRLSLKLDLLLPPGGKVSYLLPWPLTLGTRRLTLRLRRGEVIVKEEAIPIPHPADGLHGYLGPPPAEAHFPAVPLTPIDISDPLLLSSFHALSYTPELLSPNSTEIIRAWEAYLSDRKENFPPREVLVEALGEIPLAPRPLGAVAVGSALYLIALGFALGKFARTGSPRPYLAVLFLAFTTSGTLSALFIRGERVVEVHWEIREAIAPHFALIFAGIATQEGTDWTLPGIRFELLPEAEGSWVGRDVNWWLGPGGDRTAFTVAPGKERIFWSLEPRELLPLGDRFQVGGDGEIQGLDGRRWSREGFLRAAPRGVRPLLRWLLERLSPGDAIWVQAKKEVHKRYARYHFSIYVQGSG
jgi:hypothetical protein